MSLDASKESNEVERLVEDGMQSLGLGGPSYDVKGFGHGVKSSESPHEGAGKSLCRQDYSQECEEVVDEQIKLELHASYVFLAMSSTKYHDPVVDDVTIPSLNQLLSNQSDLFLLHAQMLMQYQTDRGGHIVLQDIKKPERDRWGTGLEACEAALELAREVNGSLLGMRRVARKNGDRHMMDFINDNLLQKQVQSIHALSVFLTKLKRSAEGYGD